MIGGGVEAPEIALGVVLVSGTTSALMFGGIPMWFRSDRDL